MPLAAAVLNGCLLFPLWRFVGQHIIGRTCRVAADAEPMSVRVFNVHLAYAPGNIGRRLTNDRAAPL
jgi:hypothetical protein